MKYLVVLVTLFAAVIAQDLSCRAKFLDSFVSRGGYYGSMVNVSASDKGFFSMVGRIARAVDYISDNPAASKEVRNATFLTYDGITGDILTGGWTWSLCINETLFTTGMLDGERLLCSISKCATITPASETASQLKTLFPTPGIPSKPGAPAICQGELVLAGNPLILNIVWRVGPFDELIYSSMLSETSNFEYKQESMRKLNENDRKDFDNVCGKSEFRKVNEYSEFRKVNEYSDLYDKITSALSSIF